MDTLTFNAPILLRHLTFSEARKTPISEINLQKALEGLEMTMSQVSIVFSYTISPHSEWVCRPQFVELCLLLGCDYLEPIKGIGPKSALKLVREYGSLDKVIDHLREKCAP